MRVKKTYYKDFFYVLANNLSSWVIIIDNKYKIQRINQSFLKLINKKEQEIKDKNLSQICPFLLENHINQKIKIAFNTNKEIYEEIKLKIKKQKYIINLKLIPFIENKDKNKLLIILENITQIDLLTRELKQINLFINNLFNSLRVYGIIIADKSLTVKRFNKGAEILFEYTEKEVLNKLTIKDFFPEQSKHLFNEIMDSLKILNLIRREVVLKNKLGEIFFTDVTVSKMIDTKGDFSGYIFLATDISEQKKLQQSIEKQNVELVRLYEETQKTNKAKSHFLANMSHELRTPLTAILGFSEILTDNEIGHLNEKQKDFIKDIHDSGAHLLSLINDILDLSKIEADRIDIKIENICLQNIINDSKTFIIPLVKEKKIKLIDNLPLKNIFIKADELRLKQVFFNLYSNATKFTPANGSITTDVKIKNNKVFVSIIDSGIGISKENQKIIFEEFLQIENPYSKKYNGTGLGLALVKKFMKLMKGEVSVKSDGEGKGIFFYYINSSQ